MHKYIKYILRKKYSMSSVRNKDELIVCHTHKKTYFRMEIFLRKVAECTHLGKWLFWIEVHFNLELEVDLLSTVYLSTIYEYAELCH